VRKSQLALKAKSISSIRLEHKKKRPRCMEGG
jgi:hypothetical protein